MKAVYISQGDDFFFFIFPQTFGGSWKCVPTIPPSGPSPRAILKLQGTHVYILSLRTAQSEIRLLNNSKGVSMPYKNILKIHNVTCLNILF